MNGVADLGLEPDLLIQSCYFLQRGYFFKYNYFAWNTIDSFLFSFSVGQILPLAQLLT